MKRRELREHTFKMVYMKQFHPAENMSGQEDLYLSSEELQAYTDEEREALRKRADDVLAKTDEIDSIINTNTTGWNTERMGSVDLAILRLALFEIRFDDDVPDRVAINEAVELAKKFGGEESPRFINGVLGRIMRAGE